LSVTGDGDGWNPETVLGDLKIVTG